MSNPIKAPACHLSWTVTQVSRRLFAVAATLNGADYDFVGNFQSLREAHAAGRLYANNLAHQQVWAIRERSQTAQNSMTALTKRVKSKMHHKELDEEEQTRLPHTSSIATLHA